MHVVVGRHGFHHLHTPIKSTHHNRIRHRHCQEFIYTPLAGPLLAFVESNKAQSDPDTSASLNINLVLGSDYYDANAGILTADYGFQGYMGVPGLIGTGPASRAAAYANNVAWGKSGRGRAGRA